MLELQDRDGHIHTSHMGMFYGQPILVKCIEILRGVGRNILAAIPTSLPYGR